MTKVNRRQFLKRAGVISSTALVVPLALAGSEKPVKLLDPDSIEIVLVFSSSVKWFDENLAHVFRMPATPVGLGLGLSKNQVEAVKNAFNLPEFYEIEHIKFEGKSYPVPRYWSEKDRLDGKVAYYSHVSPPEFIYTIRCKAPHFEATHKDIDDSSEPKIMSVEHKEIYLNEEK